MARAYSLALASVVAPFEYVSLPINTLWGLVLWHQFPTLVTWVGAGLTLLSGLYTLYQDQKERSEKTTSSAAEDINPINYENAET
jgi:drug/metabolite transporter (DMT)-like permease